MKTLIRGILWTSQAEKDEARNNLQQLQRDRLLDLSKAEADVIDWATQFLTSTGEAPALQFTLDHFESANLTDAALLTEECLPAPMYTGGTWKKHYEKQIEEQAAANLSKDLKEAQRIATTGVTDRQGQTTKGTDAAVSYLFTTIRGTPKDAATTMPANMRESGSRLKALYLNRKNNPATAYGVMTGYGFIDASTGGIRKGQLYVHAGFKGHLKSTMMLNMALNAAVAGGWNPLIFTSEMPQEELMFLLTAIHSANQKFSGTHIPLNAFRLILGNLTQEEEGFYDLVYDDLTNNPDHGTIRVVDSSEFTTFGSCCQRTVQEHNKEEVDQMWTDYITRLPVDLKYRGMDLTTARNETLADAKRFAMSFDNGRGLAVCTPFQVNREGYKRAKDNEGKLDKTSLAQYNAVEAEADVITYSWYDEEEAATSEPKVGMLKSRYGAVIYKPVPLFLETDSRRIFDLSGGLSAPPTGIHTAAEDEVTL